MLNIKFPSIASPQGTIVLIAVLEFVFLGAMIYVFQSSRGSPELRDVLKGGFIGWNTALALALNSGSPKEPKDKTDPPVDPTVK